MIFLQDVDTNNKGTNSTTEPSQTKNNTPDSGKNTYALIASIIGIIFGAALGYFLSAGLVSIFIVVLCTVGGAIVGATVGSYLGNYIQKVKDERHRENKNG
jgi:uncharacterized membrane protein